MNGMRITEESILKSFSLLEEVYKEIPRTKGCEKACSPGGCKAYCCFYQTPSLFYSEFLYLWNDLMKTCSTDIILLFITRSIKNFLRNSITKTCVLFDEDNCRCFCHKTRPYCCYLYGVVHPHKWKKRVKSIKQQSLNDPAEDKKDLSRVINQCDLVRCVDGRKHISEKQEDEWFERVKQSEIAIGVPQEIVDFLDQPKGSYRAIHDHIMLNTFPADLLEMLSKQRVDRISEKEINELTGVLLQKIENVAQQSNVAV